MKLNEPFGTLKLKKGKSFRYNLIWELQKHPYFRIAMGFLSDTTKWEISGGEEVAGVDTIVIKGILNDDYSKRYTADNFKLNVDLNTGILLQMEVKDATGKIKESIKTTSIKINGDLNNKLFTIQ